jgi:hypothetical protein
MDDDIDFTSSSDGKITKMLQRPSLYKQALQALQKQNKWLKFTAEDEHEDNILQWVVNCMDYNKRFEEDLFRIEMQDAEEAAEDARVGKESKEKEYKTWGRQPGGSTPENELDEGIKLTLIQIQKDEQLRTAMNSIINNMNTLDRVQQRIERLPIERFRAEADQHNRHATLLADRLLARVNSGEISNPEVAQQIRDLHEENIRAQERQVGLDERLNKIGAAQGVSEENRALTRNVAAQIHLIRFKIKDMEFETAPVYAGDKAKKEIRKLGHIDYEKSSEFGRQFKSDNDNLKTRFDTVRKDLDKEMGDLQKTIKNDEAKFLTIAKEKGYAVSGSDLQDIVKPRKIIESPDKKIKFEDRHEQLLKPVMSSVDKNHAASTALDENTGKKNDSLKPNTDSLETASSTSSEDAVNSNSEQPKQGSKADPDKKKGLESSSSPDAKKDDSNDDGSSSDMGPSI